MAAAADISPQSYYIQHHLVHLNNIGEKQSAVANFAVINYDSLFWSILTGPMAFFWGEAFKLGTATLILGLAAWNGDGWLVWPALLLGLLCVLKGYVLLLAFRKLP